MKDLFIKVLSPHGISYGVDIIKTDEINLISNGITLDTWKLIGRSWERTHRLSLKPLASGIWIWVKITIEISSYILYSLHLWFIVNNLWPHIIWLIPENKSCDHTILWYKELNNSLLFFFWVIFFYSWGLVSIVVLLVSL